MMFMRCHLYSFSRIRHLQDLQIPGYSSNKRESYFLHVVRVVRKSAQCERYQEWFPSTGRKTEQEQDGLDGIDICMLRFRIHAAFLHWKFHGAATRSGAFFEPDGLYLVMMCAVNVIITRYAGIANGPARLLAHNSVDSDGRV